ncbi:MAG: hypothetical protein XD63_0844 [Thermoanaerobacterales bacterium 50_218]|nr:MAG: hypothetical protein XD63_0844 [Thermoanaerobacterales bacterium 50_218]
MNHLTKGMNPGISAPRTVHLDFFSGQILESVFQNLLNGA